MTSTDLEAVDKIQGNLVSNGLPKPLKPFKSHASSRARGNTSRPGHGAHIQISPLTFRCREPVAPKLRPPHDDRDEELLLQEIQPRSC